MIDLLCLCKFQTSKVWVLSEKVVCKKIGARNKTKFGGINFLLGQILPHPKLGFSEKINLLH